MRKRTIADTSVAVSELALGTVKFGRNQAVKYPSAFDLPSDQEITHLLALSHDNGITTLDTAAAYGIAEERIGKLLTNRHSWQIITKAGERYDPKSGESHYDYSPKVLRKTLEQSLRALRTDYIDCWMLHSNGNDTANLSDEVISTLLSAKKEGLVRSVGASTKTVDGGSYALEQLDCVMMTLSLQNQAEKALFETARRLGKSLFLKKIYDSGWALTGPDKREVMQQTLREIFLHPAIASAVIGTINPHHLLENIEAYNQNPATATALTPALFLDRDGIINRDVGYAYRPDQIEFLPGIFELCRHYQQQGYRLIITTNQSGIARGLYSEADFTRLNQWMKEQFRQQGVTLTGIFHCPHLPEITGPCPCRKPEPGMLLAAIEKFRIEPRLSIMLGDRESDMVAAERAGVAERFLLQEGPSPVRSTATRQIRSLSELVTP